MDREPLESSSQVAPSNGAWKELLARLEREVAAQTQSVEERAAHVREREERLRCRRKRLGDLAGAIKRDRRAIVEMEASLRKQSQELIARQAVSEGQNRDIDQLRHEAEQARHAAVQGQAEIERQRQELDRQTRALEQRQGLVQKQQEQLTAERVTLAEIRQRLLADQATLEAQREALAQEQASFEQQTLALEEQTRQLEAIHAAIEERQLALAQREGEQVSHADTRTQLDRERKELEAERLRIEALEHEYQLKLEHIQTQQAEIETLERQWDARLAEASAREEGTPQEPALAKREAELSRREQAFRKKHDELMHELLVRQERLRKAERRTERFAASLENRRTQLRRGRRLLRERWREYYEKAGGNGQASSFTDGLAESEDSDGDFEIADTEVAPAQPAQRAPAAVAGGRVEPLVWLTPSVWAAMVVGLAALAAASYGLGRVLVPPVYRATAELRLNLPAGTSGDSVAVEQGVLAATIARMEGRNLRPFESVDGLRAAVSPGGTARFERIGDDRYAMTYHASNPDLAVLILEAWGDSALRWVSASGATGEFIRRPAYDPSPLAGVERKRWGAAGGVFALLGAVYLIGLIALARRTARQAAQPPVSTPPDESSESCSERSFASATA